MVDGERLGLLQFFLAGVLGAAAGLPQEVVFFQAVPELPGPVASGAYSRHHVTGGVVDPGQREELDDV